MIYWNANRKLWIWLSQATHRESSRGEKKATWLWWKIYGKQWDITSSVCQVRIFATKLRGSRRCKIGKGRSYAAMLGLKVQWMDRRVLLNNNSHDLEAEADLHMEDVTVKSNFDPKRLIASNSFVKEELISKTMSAHLDRGMKTSKISSNLPQFDVRPSEIKAKMWGNINHQRFCEEIKTISITRLFHFRRNIF